MSVIISSAAAAARIDRRLRREGGRLLKCRETCRDYHRLGDYYTLDVAGFVDVTDVDLEEFGRSIGVIRSHEAVRGD